MKTRKTILALLLLVVFSPLFSQEADSITIRKMKVESEELLDLYYFQNISFHKMTLQGENLKNKYVLLTSKEYWNSKLTKLDTLINAKKDHLKNGADSMYLNIMAQKVSKDSIKVQFNFPRYFVAEKFVAGHKNKYSLRNLAKREAISFASNEEIDLVAYSLPYVDPDKPGYSFYCELTREGIPPEKWGEHFGVKHYIVFQLQILD